MATAPIHILLVEDEPAHTELIEWAFEPYQTQYDLTVVSTLAVAQHLIGGFCITCTVFP